MKPLAAIFCGDRDWTNQAAVLDTANRLFVSKFMGTSFQDSDDVLIEGHARGADRIAHDIAHILGIKLACFPADWDKHHRAAGPIRNKQMLEYLMTYEDTHDLMVVAFHDDLENSTGTKDMVKRARRRGVRCVNIRHKK